MAKRVSSRSKQSAPRPSASAAARAATDAGKRLATKVHREGSAALRARAEAIAAAPRRARSRAATVAPRFIRAAGVKGIGTLVAEGDSWFDYPWMDVLDVLGDLGYEIESVASKGDRVEDMAYGGGQLAKFRRVLEKVLRRAELPRAILLSGGGNDIAGTEFAMLLEHASSPTPGPNAIIVREVIDLRIRNAYITILASVTELCKTMTGQTLPILVHGYDLPVPDGRGFLGGWGPLPGPWLQPGFRQKGYENQNLNRGTIGALIDQFNVMLKGVAAMAQFKHVRYVDLRGTLPSGSSYKEWWADELHPTRKGFRAVAAKFANVIP